MSSKSKVIGFGLTLILIISLLTIYLAIPKITIRLNGTKNEVIKLGEEYIELGANAYYKNIFHSENINLETYGTVDTKKVGKYSINYRVNYHNIIKEETRIVEVIDDEKPTLMIKNEIKACKNNGKVDIDVIASDNYDGDISDKIKYKINDDKVYLSVSDSSNNTTETEKTLNYIDNEKPIITLKGSKEIYLKLGEQYTELGANANDSCDGDISTNITTSGSVNSNELGTYEIIYKVKDSALNEVQTKRIIYVKDKNDNNFQYSVTGDSIIYLTFDDGPGAYTDQILDILDTYNIKATFFVTNQFGNKYQYLIKKEYEKGHTIGIHTYSHKWTIYKSVETYLEDFEKIQEIVITQTGLATKLFRFPGGSSNTVSRNYCKGIMTKLSKIMTDKGYIYYDWTFDSGDTNKSDNSKEAIINNVKRNLKGNGEYIILMHDIKKNTLSALPEIIEYGKSKGYTFAPLTENVNPPRFKIAN